MRRLVRKQLRFVGLCAGLALPAVITGTATAADDPDYVVPPHNQAPKPPPLPPVPPPAPVAGCADQLRSEEHDGLARIEVVSPCRAGKTLHVTYRGDIYTAAFDSTGHAVLTVSLFDPVNALVFDGSEGKDHPFQVAFPGAPVDVKVALLWDAPVRLDMHVIEPGKALGGPDGDVARDHPNSDLSHGLGSIDLASDGAGGGIHVLDYLMKPPHVLTSGLLRAWVDYVSRGDHPSGDYCGDGAYASVTFRFRTLVAGNVTEGKVNGLGAVACGNANFERLAYHYDVPLAPPRRGGLSEDRATGGMTDGGKPAPLYVGVASIRADGTIDLYLDGVGKDAARGTGHLTYSPSSHDYAAIAQHVGPLKPGEQKPVKPWPDNTLPASPGKYAQ